MMSLVLYNRKDWYAIKKETKPVLGGPHDSTVHFRYPKIYIIQGSNREFDRPAVALGRDGWVEHWTDY